jgi:octanoyl-[GcvH]:protein N-octanoyltransferase
MAATRVLIGAATPADPVLDVAISDALLADVAAGRRPPALRIFRPAAAVAFGRLDALRPGFARASSRARELGFEPLVRSAGGHAAVYDARSVVVEEISREADSTAALQERFAAQAERLRDVLAGVGADARIGELAGEYCPGAHSINVAGRIKVVGIAQRLIRNGSLTSAVIVVGGGADVRAAVTAVYGDLGLDVDPSTAGALDDVLPEITVEDIAARVRAAYDAGDAVAPDAELLAAARGFVERHRAPA